MGLIPDRFDAKYFRKNIGYYLPKAAAHDLKIKMENDTEISYKPQHRILNIYATSQEHKEQAIAQLEDKLY